MSFFKNGPARPRGLAPALRTGSPLAVHDQRLHDVTLGKSVPATASLGVETGASSAAADTAFQEVSDQGGAEMGSFSLPVGPAAPQSPPLGSPVVEQKRGDAPRQAVSAPAAAPAPLASPTVSPSANTPEPPRRARVRRARAAQAKRRAADRVETKSQSVEPSAAVPPAARQQDAPQSSAASPMIAPQPAQPSPHARARASRVTPDATPAASPQEAKDPQRSAVPQDSTLAALAAVERWMNSNPTNPTTGPRTNSVSPAPTNFAGEGSSPATVAPQPDASPTPRLSIGNVVVEVTSPARAQRTAPQRPVESRRARSTFTDWSATKGALSFGLRQR